jgi:hypothetical protein
LNTKYAKWIVGWGSVTTLGFLFDDVLWVAMVLWLGPIVGGAIMTTLALILNIILIKAYDTLKQDFLSFESLREFEGSEHKSLWKRIFAKISRAGRMPAFLVLSFYDPFLATIIQETTSMHITWRSATGLISVLQCLWHVLVGQ